MSEAWASVIVKKTSGKILDVEIEPDEETAQLRVDSQNARLDSRVGHESGIIRWAVARVVVDYEPELDNTPKKGLT